MDKIYWMRRLGFTLLVFFVGMIVIAGLASEVFWPSVGVLTSWGIFYDAMDAEYVERRRYE